MSNTGTETKAQRVERLKREKNPWEGLDEIRRFAREGIWLDHARNGWVPIFVGGGFTPKATAPVWLGEKTVRARRFRISWSVSGSRAACCVPTNFEPSQRSPSTTRKGTADLTVRQNIQLHWVTIESLPEVLDALWRAGLTTMGSCGDDTRNITGCPLAGVDADEICDASPLGLEANRFFVGNAEFYNLPRKFKICITGCKVWCAYPEINDVGLTAIRRAGDDSEIGYSLRVGGGLSTDPHLAVRLNAFVRRQQVIPVLKGIAEIFRESEKLRENRERARLKFLFLKHGWTADSFQHELEQRIGFRLEPAAEERPPQDVYRDHVGIHQQKQPGYCYVGAAVLRGRITAQQMQAAADLSDRFANGELRTTNMQNLLIVNVPRQNVDTLSSQLNSAGLLVAGSPFWRGAIACSGSEFCKLAITETKSFSRWLVEELEERLPGFEQHLKLHVTGCPNSCGQHWIADVGIEGKKIKIGDRMVDAYYFCVGGAVGLHQSVARPVGYRCPASEVPDAIERLLRRYLDERLPAENLRRFFARYSDEELRECLAGELVAAVARDPSPGRAPHVVEG